MAEGASAGRADRPPFFVIGYKRSGTTLLRLVLDAHPDLSVPTESEIAKIVPPMLRGRAADDALRRTIAERIARDPRCNFHTLKDADAIEAALGATGATTAADVMAACYRLGAREDGKPDARWGDKKPQHWKYLEAFAAWYPDAQFIHLVRDPRAVFASVERNLPEQIVGRGFLAPAIITAWQWCRATAHTERIGAALGPERFLSLRYEDMVADPEPAVRRLCDFLGVSEEPSMLQFYEDAGDRPIATRAIHGETQSAVGTHRVAAWKRSLEAGQVADIEWICRREMQRLGHEPAGSAPPAWRRIWASLACTGLDAAWAVRRGRERRRGEL